MPNIQISVAEAKARLSELLNRVAYGGEKIVITKRGKPIAVLSAPAPKGLASVKGWMDEKDSFFTELKQLEKRRHRRKLRVRRANQNLS